MNEGIEMMANVCDGGLNCKFPKIPKIKQPLAHLCPQCLLLLQVRPSRKGCKHFSGNEATFKQGQSNVFSDPIQQVNKDMQ
jgi:hypothetical protein